MPEQPPPAKEQEFKPHWNFYATEHGNRPAKEYIWDLPKEERYAVFAAMEAVIKQGMSAARHLRGDIYEVRAVGGAGSYRILFALEGRFSHIFLGIHAFPRRHKRRAMRILRWLRSVLQTGVRGSSATMLIDKY